MKQKSRNSRIMQCLGVYDCACRLLVHIFGGSSGRLLEETDKLVSSTERKKQADERETEESQQSHYARNAMSRCLCMSASCWSTEEAHGLPVARTTTLLSFLKELADN